MSLWSLNVISFLGTIKRVEEKIQWMGAVVVYQKTFVQTFAKEIHWRVAGADRYKPREIVPASVGCRAQIVS